ncbi:DUF418 domain-containing protein [Actinomycetospora sp. CA-053990]|uniref:DUF418 domain-containing protein n=1 Tax=Actinomycetospora sp. CA-053990 TaxID=3239891 RepID=UPI003D8F66EC
MVLVERALALLGPCGVLVGAVRGLGEVHRHIVSSSPGRRVAAPGHSQAGEGDARGDGTDGTRRAAHRPRPGPGSDARPHRGGQRAPLPRRPPDRLPRLPGGARRRRPRRGGRPDGPRRRPRLPAVRGPRRLRAGAAGRPRAGGGVATARRGADRRRRAARRAALPRRHHRRVRAGHPADRAGGGDGARHRALGRVIPRAPRGRRGDRGVRGPAEHRPGHAAGGADRPVDRGSHRRRLPGRAPRGVAHDHPVLGAAHRARGARGRRHRPLRHARRPGGPPAAARPLGGRGLGASVVLGLPLALAVVGTWVPAGVLAGLAGAAHTAGGYAGALGLLGVMGLLASVSWPGRDLIAGAGTWSMTLYLSQSVVFVAVFATVAGGLGSSASLTTATVTGLLVWLVGVLVAGLAARAGHRGPAELLVRRLTYPREQARP